MGGPRADAAELRALRALRHAAVPGLDRHRGGVERVGAVQPQDDLQPQRRGDQKGVRGRGPAGAQGVPAAHGGWQGYRAERPRRRVTGLRMRIWLGGAVIALLAAGAAQAAGKDGGHADPFAPILLELAVVVLAAALGRRAAGLVGQPAVLGELVIGVVIGNVGYWLGTPLFVLLMHFDDVSKIVAMVWNSPLTVAEAAPKVFPAGQLGPGSIGERVVQALSGREAGSWVMMTIVVWLLSNLGVTLLLFMVGMESSVDELVGVGPRALAVAVIGIVAPFAAGFMTTSLLLPQAPTAVHLFVGATLSATSVGITARVFQDLRRLQSDEARLILSAAVIDDVLGLIVLAVVAGVIATGGIHLGEVARIALLSAAFMAAVVFLGDRIARRLADAFRRLEPTQTRVLFALTLAFLMSWLANRIC